MWTTDGTAAGTVQLTGIAGANSAGIFTATVSPDFTVYNGEVLFNGLNNAPTPAQGLSTTNGTAAGTTEIAVNGAASTGVNPSDMTVFNGSVLFNGVDTAGNNGLWTTNGTTARTQELTPIIGARTTGGLDPTDMTVFNSEVLFNGVDATGTGLAGLWVTNGTAAGTHEITGIADADPSGLDPTDLTVFGNEVLFNGLDQNGDRQLWVTDGTAAGTQELTGIPGANSSANASGIAPSDLTVFNGEVFTALTQLVTNNCARRTEPWPVPKN